MRFIVHILIAIALYMTGCAQAANTLPATTTDTQQAVLVAFCVAPKTVAECAQALWDEILLREQKRQENATIAVISEKYRAAPDGDRAKIEEAATAAKKK